MRQSNPHGGLMEFVRYFWHVLEPVDPFVEGWPLECMCAHLEAITRGEIIEVGGKERPFNRLWINVPPGFMKSMLVNIFWPAWEWGPMGLSHLRYVAFSYAADLTLRDNAKFRSLITSQAYQELWGHVFKITRDGEVRVQNDKTGFKFATSIGGVGTGERGHRILCFPAQQPIWTETGPKPIAEIDVGTRVWTFNQGKNALELAPVLARHRNHGRPLVRITTANGAVVTCTHDHEIYTDKGRKPAASLLTGDLVLGARHRNVLPGASRSDKPNCGGMNVKRASQVGCRIGRVSNLDDVGIAKPTWHAAIAGPWRHQNSKVSPLSSGANAVNRGNRCLEFFSERPQIGWGIVFGDANRNLRRKILSQVRRTILPHTVPLAVINVLGARPIFEIIKAWIAARPVFMPHLKTGWAWAQESLGHQSMAHAIERGAIASQGNAWIPLIKRPRHYFPFNSHRTSTLFVRDTIGVFAEPSGPTNGAWQTSNSPKIRHLVIPFEPDNRTPYFDRVASVDFLAHEPDATFCLTVGENRSLCCGESSSVLAANCDDIHKIKTAESDEARQSTVNWVIEAMQNRLNDLTRDVIVGVMQRTHENDASGAIQKQLHDQYCHLIIPMEYEPGRHFSHYRGWRDGEDPRRYERELAWKDRYPPDVLASFKRNQYLWSGQYQQNPVPRGGGLFKEHWWQPFEVPRSGSYEWPGGRPLFTIASLDTAFKEKEESDYSALTVWGAFDDPKTGNRRIMMIDAWKKKLPLHGERVQRRTGEDERDYMRRSAPKWGLVEWVEFTCSRRGVEVLLVEDSARGHDVNNELQRIYTAKNWSVQMIPARGDKWVRAQAALPVFTDEMVYAPGQWHCTAHGKAHCDVENCAISGAEWRWRDWVQEVIDEMATFPRGAHDDLVDSCTMALNYLRRRGIAIRREERDAIEEDLARYKKPLKPLY